MQPVVDPALLEIARALPADTAFQITHIAERLGFTDYSDVLAEVANSVIRKTADPKGNSHNPAAALAEDSFPRPPPTWNIGTEPASAHANRTNSRSKPTRPTNLSS
jgi:hypothetical protein